VKIRLWLIKLLCKHINWGDIDYTEIPEGTEITGLAVLGKNGRIINRTKHTNYITKGTVFTIHWGFVCL